MVGIDVIDLTDPLLKGREKALRFILHSEDTFPDIDSIFWIIWTAKEAIFKSKREIKSFDPKQIQVTIFQSGNQIHFSSNQIAGKVLIETDRVIAIAQQANNLISHQVIEKSTANHSQEVRRCIEEHFHQEKSIKLAVSKDANGLPILDYRKLPISISHHGRFLSFAYPHF